MWKCYKEFHMLQIQGCEGMINMIMRKVVPIYIKLIVLCIPSCWYYFIHDKKIDPLSLQD